MFETLEIFRMSNAMAVHAGQKQAVTAQNVANADTPGFKAQDLPGFGASYAAQPDARRSSAMKATRSGHIDRGTTSPTLRPVEDRSAEASPDGNTVSLETEMLRSVDAKRQHDQALAIYKSALGVLRTSLGR